MATKRESSAIFVAEGETDVFALLFWLGGREHDRPIRLGTFSPFAAAAATSDRVCRVSLYQVIVVVGVRTVSHSAMDRRVGGGQAFIYRGRGHGEGEERSQRSLSPST